jgi:outer membrane lipoprotein SlyB
MFAKPPSSTVIALLVALSLTACGGVHSGGTYARGQAGEEQHVSRGTIVSMRDVRIDGTNSGIGQIGGGVLGGVAGSTIGSGTRATIAGAVVGAVAGAVLGTVAEQQVTRTTATEFTVREESGLVIAVVQDNDEGLREGDRVVVLRGSRTRVIRDAGRAN